MTEPFKDLPAKNYGEQEEIQVGKVTVVMLPEGLIALIKEVHSGLHPRLEKLLNSPEVVDLPITIAEIATYCQVVLDSRYTQAELDKLCFILAGRLEAMRELPGGMIVH